MDRVVDVQAEIKRQVAVYMAMQHEDIEAAGKNPTPATQCGLGDIDFRLTKINTELITNLDVNGGIQGDVPVPTITVSKENNQTLSFPQIVVPDFYQDPAIFEPGRYSHADRENAVLATTLRDLRRGLVKASGPQSDKVPRACLTSYTPDPADLAGTFEIGITAKVDGKLAIEIGPLKWGPAIGGTRAETSTIKVTFEPFYAKDVQLANDMPKKCKKPDSSVMLSCRAKTGQLAWCDGCGNMIKKEDVIAKTQEKQQDVEYYLLRTRR
ncbi:hypothetical protein AWV80_23385 [Cupriavidus sp. UYMU48A]|nr:hypothetical protein AWV80_23385 [Cupriavidus sp. UYMU48A]